MSRRSQQNHVSRANHTDLGVHSPCDSNGNLVESKQRAQTQNGYQEEPIQLTILRISDQEILKVVRQFSKLKVDSVQVESSAMLKYEHETIFERRSTMFCSGSSSTRGHRSCDLQPKSPYWDINVDIPKSCRPVIVEIPDSVKILRCSSCSGNKSLNCNSCHGYGRVECKDCCRFGVTDCEGCSGNGTLTCSECKGSRAIPCECCRESGKIRQCTQLTIKWNKKQKQIYSGNKYHLPEIFLKECLASQIYESAPPNGRVYPLSKKECLNLNHEIIEKSRHIVMQHLEGINSNAKLRKQKHCIGVLPVHKISCVRKGKAKEFWIVGTNHRVYSPQKKAVPCCIVYRS